MNDQYRDCDFVCTTEEVYFWIKAKHLPGTSRHDLTQSGVKGGGSNQRPTRIQKSNVDGDCWYIILPPQAQYGDVRAVIDYIIDTDF